MTTPMTEDEYNKQTEELKKQYDEMIAGLKEFDDYEQYKNLIFPFNRPPYRVYLRDFEIDNKKTKNEDIEITEPGNKISKDSI